MNFYLELLDRETKKHHENPSIGVVLCKTNVSYGVNPLIISALWECPPPAAAKKIY
jgi:hypothetical protein